MTKEFDPFDVPESFEGGDRPVEGSYHFRVIGIDEAGGRNGAMKMMAEVLAGTTPNQEGRIHHEYFNWPSPDQEPDKRVATAARSLQLAIALGLATEEELLKAREAKRRVAIDYNLAVGRQFCGRLTKDVYEGKTKYRLGYDIWPVGSPKAQGIPFNLNELKKAGDAGSAPFDAQGPAEPTTSPPKSPWG